MKVILSFLTKLILGSLELNKTMYSLEEMFVLITLEWLSLSVLNFLVKP